MVVDNSLRSWVHARLEDLIWRVLKEFKLAQLESEDDHDDWSNNFDEESFLVSAVESESLDQMSNKVGPYDVAKTSFTFL